ncbi:MULTISPECIES: hypothetical protein [Pontibacillus]|uniref:Paeninodin family lasso peptide n=1 Tax=Pontibacillus chungwhensis TaxID=265426 RepID=A0ABY8V0J8_9BACI|nr:MULTISPECIES: hypothetical protein [Pontibacillus]MCD5324999.1 hypothetical protein [Pontibacillus sp. HN14]WIF98953.1 hypothetical protein QNI29_04670 [Pontibacillus chungwhensis]
MGNGPLTELEINTSLNPDFGMNDDGFLLHAKDVDEWELPTDPDYCGA